MAYAKSLGPHPFCPLCKGTGKTNPSSAKGFRCPCRWSTSDARANAYQAEIAALRAAQCPNCAKIGPS